MSELSGTNFNKIHSDVEFYKITNVNEVHGMMHYKDGRNVDKIKFNPHGTCLPGGIYFARKDYISMFLTYGFYIRKVRIPDEARVYEDGNDKFKADMVDLEPRVPIKDSFLVRDKKYIYDTLKYQHKLFEYVPKQILDEKICMRLLERDSTLFAKFPADSKTRRLCLQLIRCNGSILYIPENMRFEELYLLAFARNYGTFQYIPTHLLGKEKFCIDLVTRHGLIIKEFADEMKTLDVCHTAIKQNGLALQYVPDELKDHKLCSFAVHQNGLALQYVPYDIRTHNMCEIAIKAGYDIVKHIPSHIIIEDLYLKLIEYDSRTLRLMPFSEITEKMCEISIQKWRSINGIPMKILTQDMCDDVFDKDGWSFEHIPDEFKTQRMYSRAIGTVGCKIFKTMPDKFKTRKLCEEVIGIYGSYAKYLPERFKDIPEKVFIKKNYVFTYVSKEIYYDETLAKEFAKKNMHYAHLFQHR